MVKVVKQLFVFDNRYRLAAPGKWKCRLQLMLQIGIDENSMFLTTSDKSAMSVFPCLYLTEVFLNAITQ